jgi:hypothetical protein
MRKFVSLFMGLCFLLSFSNVKADEGMWLLSLLKKQNVAEMQQMGLKLTGDDIYNINNSSLKDAIVGLGSEGRPFRHFCTGEIISDQGLFLTNHHCGFGAIQSHSTTEHNYLEDGFWAYSKNEELTNPGITASILIRMADVTDQIAPKLNEKMTDEERYETIDKIAKEIEKKAEEGTEYKANVKSMFEGNQFFLFVYVIYKDVRLVGAPPQSMGKFGGDTDNWMWPRHTADFSMFRIYTGKDGKPAAYSKDNVPLKPKHHLPVSIKGQQEKDFAMIMGFPGTTDRYLTSFGLKETMDITNANRYKIRTVKLANMLEEMEKAEATRIKYASKYASTANYWKYSNEQNKALKALNTMGAKQEIEKKFTEWVNASEERKAKYGEALKYIEEAYTNRSKEAFARSYMVEALLRGPELPSFTLGTKGLLKELKKGKEADQEKINEMVKALKEEAKAFYKDYDPTTEKKLIASLFEVFANNVDKNLFPSVFTTIEKKFKNDFNKYAETLMAKSVFATKAKFNAFLEKPSAKVLEKDMAYTAGTSILKAFRNVNKAYAEKSGDKQKGIRLFVAGLLEMQPEKAWAPDANSTLRLTYGKVGGYSPKDAVDYNYYTTLEGVIEKMDPTSFEFKVPAKLVELYEAKDYGQYADANGKLHTCFLTDHDITGGNSGSPVINANGELIGTAFDGNSEAMSGDIDFEENLQRCINLDVRYTLWIIDKFAGAKNLIEEMTIVK